MKKFFNVRNCVSNKELADSLDKSIEHNENALEWIAEKKRVANDLYLYTEKVEDKKGLEIIEYIEFVLKFVGAQYSDNLKRLK